MWSLIIEIFNILLSPRYRYRDRNSWLQARVTLAFSMMIAVGAFAVFIGAATTTRRTEFVTSTLTTGLAAVLIQLMVIGLIHAGQLRPAMYTLFAFLVLAAVTAIFLNGVGSSALVLALTPIVYGAVLLPWFGVLLLTLGEIILILVTAALQMQQPLTTSTLVSITAENIPTQVSIVLVGVVAVGVLSGLLSYTFQRSIRWGTRLLTQFRASTEVAQLTVTATSLGDLMTRTANYIRDRFGFYHVQIFLADPDRRFANLVASTGEAGQTMLTRGYRLSLNSQSAIGRAIQLGEPIVVDSREEPSEFASARRASELLPDTRSELAIPLIAGDQVIGALDIQSVRPNAFEPELVDSLSILSGQIGSAAYNAQQQADYRATLSDTRRMLLETEVNLRESQRLNQKLTGQAWDDYLRARSTNIIGYTLSDNRLLRDPAWTTSLQQAAGSRRPVIIQQPNDRLSVAVPIELRGRPIGAIEIELEGKVRQAETLEVLQSLAQRLALSIDNARLFEQAQELAQRELEVNAISTSLQTINDIEGLARATLQELARALGAGSASIRIGDPGTAHTTDSAGQTMGARAG